MYRSSAKGLKALLVSVAAGLLLVSPALFGAEAGKKVSPKVIFPKASKVTGLRPLGSHLKRPVPGATRKEIPIQPLRRANPDYKAHGPALPRTSPTPLIPDPLLTFEGVGDVDFVQPADTTLAVGPAHIFQWVNGSAEIFDKDGNDLSGGPFEGTAFWQDLGGDCANVNGGDIIVIYDHLADRWIATQLAAFIQGASTNNVCWAVSKTGDPLGEYFQYDFDYGGDLNDYPKWALWPDAYYGTFRNFVASAFFSGMVVWAVDRNAVLAGDANPTILAVDVGEDLPNLDGLLGANLSPGDPGPPLARRGNAPGGGGGGTPPETLFGVSNPGLDGDPSAIRIFQFHPDFGNPPASTFSGPVDVAVTDFTPSSGSVEQPAPGGTLEDLPWVMYKADYRNFGTHEGVVLSHTEDVGGGQIGVRWYEVRDPAGTPTLFQEGTFAPDSSNRWFPSIAQDFTGDIAVGYSVADGSIFPSIRYAGRLVGDPLGELSQGEGEFFQGNGSFGGDRWGDYSTISLDPVDQCTFWYTTMYVPGSGLSDWSTGVGSFKFNGCTTGPAGTISGTVTDGTNPIAGVKVAAGIPSTTTDATGAYQLTLPVGMYDMTASKYGYIPGFANGVEVTEDNNTVQDFTLGVAPTTEVNGTVKDGSGGGWPLAANIKITGPGAPTFNIQTDPVTGYYSMVLVQGITYTFQVTAIGPGYLPGGGTVDLSLVANTPGGVVKNWELLVNAETCNAPGYTPDVQGLYEDFEGGGLPKGWEITNETGNDTWYINLGADPFCGDFAGNLTGGTGYYAVVNSDCAGFADLDTSLVTSSVDMSSFSSATIRFNTDYRHYNPAGDIADVDISTNGGSSWTNVWEKTADARGPRLESVDITSLAAGQADVKARFHYYNAFYAWWWQVDNVLLGSASCNAGSGGLVVGKVTSAGTGQGLNGAKVKNLPDDAETLTFNAPGQGDGFYILFAESGMQPFEASLALYGSQQKSTLVVPNASQRLDFQLPSGVLTATPAPLNGRADPGDTDQQTLTMTNTGTAAASFVIGELDIPASAPQVLHRPHADEEKTAAALARIPKGKDRARTTQGIPEVPRPDAPEAAGGEVIASYPSGLPAGWGVASDTDANTVWFSNIALIGGDDFDYEYDAADGTQTGNTIDDSTWVDVFAADGAWDSRTGMVWRVNVGDDTCIYELDPVNHVATGNKICPAFGTSERGLAYDPVTDTFWAGGWNDLAIVHFDTSGTILDSAFVGIPISGLAYDPRAGNLYAMQNADSAIDIWILDAATYSVTGFLTIKENGSPVMTPFGGAGIDPDCDGNLWVIDQNTQTIYKVASGATNFCVNQVTWLSEDPTEGTVDPASVRAGGASSLPVTVTFDSTGLNPGLRQAQLTFRTDTPTPVAPVPVNFTVRFLDVPDSNQFEAYIYGAAGAGIMTGCGADNFCPNGVVTRADMAGYIERAMKGADYLGSPYLGGFSDVSQQTPNANYIQALVDDGITAGCGTNIYCPNNPNTRAQMSVFIVKATEGSSFVPPACTGIFTDVPCPGGFAVDFIEYLYNQGVTAGCGGGNFCPNASITNGQMAVFLVKAFNVPHL